MVSTDHSPRIKLFLDGANFGEMTSAYQARSVQGFTTNPTLMRKGGVADYEAFARAAIRAIPDLPISFEVFSDEFGEMEREAKIISGWGGTVYVKVPITNTRGEPATELIRALSRAGIAVNVTAIFTIDQVRSAVQALAGGVPGIISVFAGRIADTGLDPMPLMKEAVKIVAEVRGAELLWASPREVLNVFQAAECGCHIITATGDVLKKLALAGKDLEEFSLETVQMFYDDARAAGYQLR
jgi:transaldolase